MATLSEQDIQAKLQAYRGWVYTAGYVVKTYRLESFAKAVECLIAISVVAQHMGVSPRVVIEHNALTFQLGGEEGVVETDMQLMREIEQSIVLGL